MSHSITSLKKGDHIHLMGVCGTAMASLAGILKDFGYKVTGSDQNVYPPMSTQLESLGIEIMPGYKKENLDPRPDLVIVGNVISKDFEEATALLSTDIPYTSFPKAMGEFVIADRNSVVVSGTHGKTSTTAILTWISDQCKKQAGYLVGGIPVNYGKSFRAPEGNWFIIEGDEYDTAFFDKVPKFIYYKPKFVVLTSLEFDHADIYSSIEEIKMVFRELVRLIPEDGVVMAYADDKNVMDVVKNAKCRVVTYGVKSGDYKAIERASISGRNHFCVEHNGDKIADLAIKQFGPHNTLNSLAAYALSIEMGWSNSDTLQALASFKGVKRRQEVIGEPNGITIVEDFAHHPTAVDLTLDCMSEAYPGRKVFAVFEPRSATARRNIFQKEYTEAFKKATNVVIATPYDQSKINEKDRMSSTTMVKDLCAVGVNAVEFLEVEEIVSYLKSNCAPGDVILIMSNGGFGGIYKKLLDVL